MIAYYNSYYVTLDGVRLVNKAPIIYLLTYYGGILGQVVGNSKFFTHTLYAI